jgi:hypothetical protein
MRFATTASLALAVSLICASSARAQVTIDFDDLPAGTLVTNQYPSATFSSEPGFGNFTEQFNGTILCTGPLGGGIPDCVHDTYIDFTVPVTGLHFMAIEPNAPGEVAQFRIFQNGVHTATVDLIGLGGGGNKPVDLTGFTHVTRLEIVNILDDPMNENGIGWDDFQFFQQSVGTYYCTAKVNSLVCTPAIVLTGVPSASGANPSTVLSLNSLSGKFGVLCYSTSGPDAVPFQGGFLCVAAPRERVGVLDSGGNSTPDCSGSYSVDLNALIASGSDAALVPGQPMWMQFYGRDPGFAAPFNTSLTDAVTAVIAP